MHSLCACCHHTCCFDADWHGVFVWHLGDLENGKTFSYVFLRLRCLRKREETQRERERDIYIYRQLLVGTGIKIYIDPWLSDALRQVVRVGPGPVQAGYSSGDLQSTFEWCYLTYPKTPKNKNAEKISKGGDFFFRVSLCFFFPVLFVKPSIAFCFWVPFRVLFSFFFLLQFFFFASLLVCFSPFLLLCFFAFLLFCFSAFLFFCFFCFFRFAASSLLCFFASLLFRLLCFSASLLLRFFLLFYLFYSFCFFFASWLVCFHVSAFFFLGCSVLLWCLCYFSTCFCLMCHGKNMGYFPIKTICHESMHRDLYTHDKDCHHDMDDHTLYTMFWP